MRPVPRDYQNLCVEHGLASLAKEKPEIIVAPTASGKSVIISELCHQLNDATLIFQPNKEILGQNYAKLASYGINDIGMFSASVGRKEIEKYTYATIGSVKGRDFRQFKYCLLDECHLHNPKAGMYKAFFKAHPKMKVLGLTATPYRMINKYVFERGMLNYTSMLQVINRIYPPFFKGFSFKVTNKSLFEKGFLSPLRYITQRDIDISRIKMNTTGADFDTGALERTMQLPDNVRKLVEAIIEEDYYTPNNLIFCSSIRHAEATGEALATEGYDSTLIHAKTPSKERDRIITDFRTGKITRLLNVGVLTTGFDFPGLYKVTVGRPILSLGLWYQIVGRVIRLDPDNRNKIGTVIDVCNNLRRLGSIESIRISGELGKEVVESSAGIMSGRPLFTYQVNNQQTINRLHG